MSKTVKKLLQGKYAGVKLPLRIIMATKYLTNKLDMLRLKKDPESADVANALSVLKELGGI